MKRWKKWTLGILAFLALLVVEEVARASIWGEENVTLVKMLAELIHANRELEDMSNTASEVAGMTNDILTTYHNVNAGIDELRNYSGDQFLFDLKQDFYHQYPGFGKLEYASRDLARWDDTHTASPFRAYDAITAVVGDVTKPLREDVASGKVRIDRELILKGESAGGFAAAHTAEAETEGFDREARSLYDQAANASPGKAAQIQARANLMLVRQQSFIMRLLARTVRLDSVNAALQYGERMDSKNLTAAQRDEPGKFMAEVLQPPALISLDEGKE